MSVFLTVATRFVDAAVAIATKRLRDPDAAHDEVYDCLLACHTALLENPLPPEQYRYYFFRSLNRRLHSRITLVATPDTEAETPTLDPLPLFDRMIVAAHAHFPPMPFLAFVLTYAGLTSREVSAQLGISHMQVRRHDQQIKAWMATHFKDEWNELREV